MCCSTQHGYSPIGDLWLPEYQMRYKLWDGDMVSIQVNIWILNSIQHSKPQKNSVKVEGQIQYPIDPGLGAHVFSELVDGWFKLNWKWNIWMEFFDYICEYTEMHCLWRCWNQSKKTWCGISIAKISVSLSFVQMALFSRPDMTWKNWSVDFSLVPYITVYYRILHSLYFCCIFW